MKTILSFGTALIVLSTTFSSPAQEPAKRPDAWYPRAEKLGPDEMFIVAHEFQYKKINGVVYEKISGSIPHWQQASMSRIVLLMSQGAKVEDRAAGDSLRFAWDREESADSLRAKLSTATPDRWVELAAWIMREARVDEVWEFLRPQEIADRFDELSPRLGRRRDLWDYLIDTWRELGRI